MLRFFVMIILVGLESIWMCSLILRVFLWEVIFLVIFWKSFGWCIKIMESGIFMFFISYWRGVRRRFFVGWVWNGIFRVICIW